MTTMTRSSHASAVAHAPKAYLLNVAIADFKAGMEKFAAMFTKNYGLKLVFCGTEAHTDGKTIVCPDVSLLARQNMTPEEINEAMGFLMTTRGYVYHEGAHVIKSDFGYANKAAKIGPKFKSLVNVLEDVRIEHWISGVWPGAREALMFTNVWVTDRIAEKAFSGKTPAPELYVQFLYALSLLGQVGGGGQKEKLWSLLDEKARELGLRYQAQVRKAQKASKTSKVYKIAEEIWNDLVKEDSTDTTEPPPAPPMKVKGSYSLDDDGDGDGAGAEESGEEEEEEEEEESDGASAEESGEEEEEEESDGASAEESGEEEEEEESDGAGAEKGPGRGGTTPGGGGDSTGDAEGVDEGAEKSSLRLFDAAEVKVEDKGSVLAGEALDAAEKLLASGETTGYRVYSTERDYIGPPEEPKNDAERQKLRQYVSKLTEETRFAFGPVKRTLEGVLKARTQSYYVRGLEEGDLDPSSLYRLAVARNGAAVLRDQARRVFQQKVHARSLDDTVCALSIDMSGSMAIGVKDRLAQQCAIIFAHALDGVNIPYEITAWSTQPHGTSTKVLDQIRDSELHAARKLFTRFGGLRVLEVKRFEEKWQAVNWRLSHVKGYHANYDGESVLLAARRLMQRKEKRKILFVLCDGIPGPDYDEDPQVFADHLHQVVAEIRNSTPIELIGIGIDAPQAVQFYKPRFVNVTNVSELPKVVVSQLKSVLL